MRYFLQLSYNGRNYSGWQRQENAISIQEVLEDNLSKIWRENIEMTGCGRTDSGVHAQQYFAHFDAEKDIPENLLYRINHILPADIAIINLFKTKEELHARFDAQLRTYKYFIHYKKNPFLEETSFLIYEWKPDIEKMNHCAKQLLGKHDFSAFEKKGSDNKTSVCEIHNATWQKTKHGLVFTISADRFLRNMVRRLTSALLLVGTNRMDEQEFINAVLHKRTLDVKLAVPAKGLFLWEIKYPPNCMRVIE